MLTFYAWDFKRSNRIPKMMDPKNELINKVYGVSWGDDGD